MDKNTNSKTVNRNLTSAETIVVGDTNTDIMDQDVYQLELMKDPPSGPLDEYRKTASFDWKKMRLFYDGEDVLKFKV